MRLMLLAMVVCLCMVSSAGYSQSSDPCNDFDKTHAKEIEVYRNNIQYLKDILSYMWVSECYFAPTFMTASLYLQELSPDHISSIGCGKYYYLKNNPKKSLHYYDIAFRYIENLQKTSPKEAKKVKADLFLYKAEVYFRRMKNLQKARENIMLSLGLIEDQSEPYFLLAEIYVASKVSNDSVLNLSRYWLAADMVEKAKQSARTAADEAKAECLIQEYSSMFPTEEQIRYRYGIKEGDIYTVRGWVGRSSICRSRR